MIESNQILDELILEYEKNPVDIFKNNSGRSAIQAAKDFMLPSYRRTIYDINEYFEKSGRERSEISILEIGPWIGLVSVTLKRSGYNVTVQEIPEMLESGVLYEKFKSENIPCFSQNLKEYNLPYLDETFDAVILCEVLEHLNFNPIPVIFELNRILKPNALLYVSLPNLAFLPKRIKFLVGQSVHDPIEFYFNQLQPGSAAIVGIHWREYTLNELKSLLLPCGFGINRHYYFHNAVKRSRNPIKIFLLRILYKLFPSLLPNLTLLAKKIHYSKPNFTIKDVVR